MRIRRWAGAPRSSRRSGQYRLTSRATSVRLWNRYASITARGLERKRILSGLTLRVDKSLSPPDA